MPPAGKLSDRAFCGAGFNDTGVAMSGLVGRRMGQLMTGSGPGRGLILRDRLPQPPFFFGLHVIGVRGVTASSEALDAMGR